MSVPSLRWIFASRLRTAASLGCVTLVTLLLFFWTDFCLWRAEANLVQRNHDAAATWVARSLWLRSEIDARTCLLQLRIARRRGDFREVETKLKQAGQLRAPRSEVQRERWLAMAQTNQFDGMQAHWNDLLRDSRDDEPEIARSHYTWAMLHHQIDVARRTLEFWHQDCPLDPEPLYLTGRYYQSMLRWEAAEEAYRRAFDLAPDNDEIRLAFAEALGQRLKASEAIPLFEKFLSKHPDDLAAAQGLAQCLATKGEIEAALRLLRGIFERHPDDFTIQKAYGEMLVSSGDIPGAVPVLEKAYRTVPEHANLANVLALALKASGRAAEAEPLFAFVSESRPKLDQLIVLERELQSNPQDLELRMKIAAITAKYVSRKDAIRWYENLLLIAPSFLPAHKELADLYRQMGDEKRADIHAGAGSGISNSIHSPKSLESTVRAQTSAP